MENVILYIKKIGRILWNNKSYIIWFLLFFTVSVLTISDFRYISTETAIVICLFLYSISLSVAMLFGERILRFVKGARPVETKEEKEYFLPIFNAVIDEAKALYPDLPKIKPYIIDSISINAVAIGSHTVAVTKGALSVLSPEELQGVILHEVAHIYNGNTKVEILNKVGNGFLSVYVIFVNIFFTVLDLLFRDLDDSDTKHLSGLLRTLFVFIRMTINLTVFIILFVGNIILSGNSRKNEFLADRFAFEVGYGEHLKNALYLIQKLSLNENMRLVDKMQEHHPRISKRIEKLENLLELEERAKDIGLEQATISHTP